MTKEQIIELWKQTGWNTVKEYSESLKNKPPILVELDPDKINPKEFWKASDIHFSTDTVCNVASDGLATTSDKTPHDIRNANKANAALARMLGMDAMLELALVNIFSFSPPVIAEIGCGYGSFKDNFITSNGLLNNYTGFDIIPRVEGCVEIMGDDGTFSDDQVEQYTNKFNLIYSCNVFQHLSKCQIRKYLKQFTKILQPGGFLVIANAESSCNKSYHYGQLVELFTSYEFFNELSDNDFAIIQSAKQHYKYTKLSPYGFMARYFPKEKRTPANELNYSNYF